jgi:TRAP-type uncharacterized transport system substrate-binding protein
LRAALAWWPWAVLAGGLLAGGWVFVKPAPPNRVVLAAGPAGGSYQWWARKYAKTFADAGVTLDVRQTFGSVDNYRHLDADAASRGGPLAGDDGGVSVAMVQSGTAPEGLTADLRAVASLYLEPVWVFHRGDPAWQLPDLRGKRVAVGPEGSGPRSLAERLLKANGVPATSRPAPAAAAASFAAALHMADQAADAARPTSGPLSVAPVAFVPLTDRAAADALRAGRVDAALFVISPRHPLAAELLSDPTVRLMSVGRHEAYARVFPFLSDVKLPRGAVDLAKDLPREDTYLLAPAANLVCRAGTHPAIVALLIQAAAAAHDRGDLLSRPGELPSTRYVEFPIDPAAAEHFRHGPPLLQRVLPWHLAAFADRMKILLLPLLTLLIPLARLAPPVYVWRMRSRIYRWYRVLREIDRKLRADAAPATAAAPEAAEPPPRRRDGRRPGPVRRRAGHAAGDGAGAGRPAGAAVVHGRGVQPAAAHGLPPPPDRAAAGGARRTRRPCDRHRRRSRPRAPPRPTPRSARRVTGDAAHNAAAAVAASCRILSRPWRPGPRRPGVAAARRQPAAAAFVAFCRISSRAGRLTRWLPGLRPNAIRPHARVVGGTRPPVPSAQFVKECGTHARTSPRAWRPVRGADPFILPPSRVGKRELSGLTAACPLAWRVRDHPARQRRRRSSN